jgi:Flp pilus assembly protein TadB
MTVALGSLAVAALALVAIPLRRWIDPSRKIVGDGAGPRAPRWRPRPRRSNPGDDDVAEWCEQVARNVRAGSSLAQAVVRAGADAPLGGAAFQPAVRALGRGHGFADALGDVDHGADPASAVGLVIPVLMACAELGGPAAIPLERVAATLHARSAERAERRTSSAQARLSARVLTTVPVGVLALLALAEPAVRASLTSRVGIVCVVVGGAFNLAGWWWMRRLIGGVG